MNTKRTACDGKVAVMTWLCRQFDKYSLEELRLAISKLENDNPIKQRWETLQHHVGLVGIVDSVSRAERVKYNSYSFMNLCNDFMKNPIVVDPGYMKLENSLKLWLKWCQAQQIDAGMMLWEIAVVIDLGFAVSDIADNFHTIALKIAQNSIRLLQYRTNCDSGALTYGTARRVAEEILREFEDREIQLAQELHSYRRELDLLLPRYDHSDSE